MKKPMLHTVFALSRRSPGLPRSRRARRLRRSPDFRPTAQRGSCDNDRRRRSCTAHVERPPRRRAAPRLRRGARIDRAVVNQSRLRRVTRIARCTAWRADRRVQRVRQAGFADTQAKVLSGALPGSDDEWELTPAFAVGASYAFTRHRCADRVGALPRGVSRRAERGRRPDLCRRHVPLWTDPLLLLERAVAHLARPAFTKENRDD